MYYIEIEYLTTCASGYELVCYFLSCEKSTLDLFE